MGAFTGDFKIYALPGARAVRLAIEQANESGDLACTLDLHKRDTQGDPNQAPAQAQRLIDDEDLVACVCGFFSGETLASGAIFEDGNVAMLSTGEYPAIRREGFRTWFRLIAASDRQASATGIYIKSEFDPRRVSIVHDNQSYSQIMARGVADELRWRFDGPMIVLNPEEADYSAAAAKVKRQRPDLVFYAGYSEQAWNLLPQLRERRVRADYVTDAGAKIARDARDADAGRAWLSCGCTDATEIEGATAFVEAFRDRYGDDPIQLAPDAYDGANAAIDALRELTGSESTEEIRAHVVAYLEEAERVDGTVKRYTWDVRGDLVTNKSHTWIWEWRRSRGFRLRGSVATLTR